MTAALDAALPRLDLGQLVDRSNERRDLLVSEVDCWNEAPPQPVYRIKCRNQHPETLIDGDLHHMGRWERGGERCDIGLVDVEFPEFRGHLLRKEGNWVPAHDNTRHTVRKRIR